MAEDDGHNGQAGTRERLYTSKDKEVVSLLESFNRRRGILSLRCCEGELTAKEEV